MTVSEHLDNPFGIQWQRYWEGAFLHLVKTVAHVAFEVDNLAAALEGQHVIIEPNSPSRGVICYPIYPRAPEVLISATGLGMACGEGRRG